MSFTLGRGVLDSAVYDVAICLMVDVCWLIESTDFACVDLRVRARAWRRTVCVLAFLWFMGMGKGRSALSLRLHRFELVWTEG